jgi:hypothetical protein
MPKCRGQSQQLLDNAFKCDTCVQAYPTKRGLSQHENRQHPLVRNEKRIAAANKPKGYGQIWTKEELETMLRLELELYGERNIASISPAKPINKLETKELKLHIRSKDKKPRINCGQLYKRGRE